MLFEDFIRCFEMLAAFNWFPTKEIIPLTEKVYYIFVHNLTLF